MHDFGLSRFEAVGIFELQDDFRALGFQMLTVIEARKNGGENGDQPDEREGPAHFFDDGTREIVILF